MSGINILIVVDADGAQAPGPNGGLGNNVYMIDTHKYVGSGAEGQAELKTVCNDGDIITWSISPVDPDSDVAITGFTGQMTNQGNNVCNPVQQAGPDAGSWSGRVDSQGTAYPNGLQYSVSVNVNGTPMSFDPFLIISGV